MSAAEGQEVARMAITTLNSIRTDKSLRDYESYYLPICNVLVQNWNVDSIPPPYIF